MNINVNTNWNFPASLFLATERGERQQAVVSAENVQPGNPTKPINLLTKCIIKVQSKLHSQPSCEDLRILNNV